MTVKRFKKIGFMCLAVALLVAVGYAYLSYNIKPVEIDSESEPYAPELPKNCGIVLEIETEKTFLYLDFSESKLNVLLNVPKNYEKTIHGYSADFTVKAESFLVSELIDRIGGIDLKLQDEHLRYTGVQIVELLENEDISKREVVTAIFNKIGKSGLTKSDFIFIIENCETNITIPDCYHWPNYIKTMCENLKIMD